jgi:uncharacterized protein
MSHLYHTFCTPKKKYVFDANRNSVFSVTDEQYTALSELEHGNNTLENIQVLRNFQNKGFCLDVVIKEIQNYNSEIVTAHLSKNIKQIILQVTQRCNLRCEYCAYSGKYSNRSHSPKSMDFDTAKKALDFILKRSVNRQEIVIGFYGGEPLLELPLIKKCVDYIKTQAPHRKVTYTITTNGTLLVPDVYEYLQNNDFSIVISLDGPKQIHDLSRRFPNGNGSYDVIMENIKTLQERYDGVLDKIMVNAVINPDVDDDCAEVYFKSGDLLPFFLYNSGFINDLYSEQKINYNAALMVSYRHEMCKVFLHMLGKLDEKYVSTLLINKIGEYKTEYKYLMKLSKLPSVCHPGGPCIAGAQRLFVNTDGKLFPCERVSEKSKIKNIGDLDNGFDYEKVKEIMNPAKNMAEHCKKCWAIMHCGMCAAQSDDLTGLSNKLRLSKCGNFKSNYEEKLKTLCFLIESGYDFTNEVNYEKVTN